MAEYDPRGKTGVIEALIQAKSSTIHLGLCGAF